VTAVGRTTLYEAFKTACRKLEKLGKTFEALQQRKAGEQAGEESPALARTWHKSGTFRWYGEVEDWSRRKRHSNKINKLALIVPLRRRGKLHSGCKQLTSLMFDYREMCRAPKVGHNVYKL